jgi:hypothetical protein
MSWIYTLQANIKKQDLLLIEINKVYNHLTDIYSQDNNLSLVFDEEPDITNLSNVINVVNVFQQKEANYLMSLSIKNNALISKSIDIQSVVWLKICEWLFKGTFIEDFEYIAISYSFAPHFANSSSFSVRIYDTYNNIVLGSLENILTQSIFQNGIIQELKIEVDKTLLPLETSILEVQVKTSDINDMLIINSCGVISNH